VRADFLEGRTVVDSEANILGEINGIEIDLKTWTVTSIWIELDDDSIITLGLKKPRFRGKVEITIPINAVNAVSDIVTLHRNHNEIKDILERMTEDN
jgi:sporulation protein YlmC with PRC-barrel domain